MIEECKHINTETRKRILCNGAIQYIKQCLKCGHSVGGAIAKARIKNGNQLNMFDEELKEYWDKLWNSLWKEQRETEKKEFNEWYSEYLQSQEWQVKRALVLKRDNYMCQGCMRNEANVVHHTTYAHAGNEFLFELISLCHECHERYHAGEDKL